MFCENCGSKNESNAVFCENCGHKIELPDQNIADKTRQPLEDIKYNSDAALQEANQQQVNPQQANPQQTSQQQVNQQQVSQQQVNPQQTSRQQMNQQQVNPQHMNSQLGNSQQSYQQQASQQQIYQQQGYQQAPPVPPYQPKSPKVKKPFPLSGKVFFAEFIILAALIAAFVIVGNKLSDPKVVVDNFANDIQKENWGNVYSSLDYNSEGLLSKGFFTSVMEDNVSANGTIVNYSITSDADLYSQAINEESLLNTYYINYTTKGSTYENTISVQLLKQSDRIFFFFPKWEVAGSSLVSVAENAQIAVPKGSSLYIDDVYVDPSTFTTTDDYGYYVDYCTVYDLGKVFEGYYDIKVTSDMYEDYESEIYLSTGTYEEVNASDIKQEILDNLTSASMDALQELFTAAVLDEDIAKDSVLYNTTYIDKLLSDIKSWIHDNEYKKFKSITFDNESYYNQQITYDSENDIYTMSLYVDFEYSVEAKSRSSISSPYEDYTEDDWGNINSKYNYVGGEWILTEFYVDGIYW